jgi:hypothetical protein
MSTPPPEEAVIRHPLLPDRERDLIVLQAQRAEQDGDNYSAQSTAENALADIPEVWP